MGMSKVTVIGLSSVVLVAVVAAVAVTVSKSGGHGGGGSSGGEVTTSNKAVDTVCQPTDYKDACRKSLSSANSSDPKELIKAGFKATMSDIGGVISKSKTLEDAAKDPRTKNAYGLCKHLLETAVDDLERSVDRVGNIDAKKLDEYVADLKTWLTGVTDYQETCIDAFANTTGDAADKMKELLKTSTELSSNALAMVTDLTSMIKSLNIPGLNRRLLEEDYYPIGDPPPDQDPGTGAGSGTRRLLEDYYPIGDLPPDQDPGTGAGSGTRRLLEDYYPIGDPPPDQDPGTGAASGTRRLLEDYYPIGDPPPDQDPGTGAGSGTRRLLEDYYPIGDPPPDQDPGTGAGSGTRRLLEDYYPIGDPPPDQDPGSGMGSGGKQRRLLAEDYDTPIGDPPPSQDPNRKRKLLSSDGLPEWASPHQRRLLQANPAPNAVVAQDGSGQFKTIGEAIKTVPLNNVKAFVIHVKAGIYKEYVDIPRHVDNIVMIGDGATTTKVTGNKNFIDGVATFQTATFAVNSDGFMAKDIGFENSAGAAKHQAVALRVSGDRAIFYRCQLDGYQDTLYAHTYRQFYRDTTITGTIDFIFGDAAAVFQNCKMIVRKPMDNQGCMVTAQGRKDRRSTGGTILQGCTITAEPALMQTKPPVMQYLGRPWKEFARTIVMQSFIDSNIVPEGWSPWTGTFGQDTCYYAEYQNRGPGSDTSKRASWKGIVKNISPQEVQQFTAGTFVQGNSWIPVAGVPYDAGMMKV